jgi:hypothetical protein
MQRTTTRVVAALVTAAIVACGATSGSTSSTFADAGDDASGEGGGAVPTCNNLIMCTCADGTQQPGPSCGGGGQSCDDACRPHGGQACFSAQACTCADGSKQWQGPCPHPTCEEVCAAHCDAGGCASDAGEDG